MTETEYFEDFNRYYNKAKRLQEANLAKKKISVDDPLMDNVSIYDTVNRRYAGFSNMLQDLWHGSKSPKCPKPEFDHIFWHDETWFYTFLTHRITGSGASFSHDHGYRNTVLPELAEFDTVDPMKNHIRHIERPIFTSIGNQIPPFNKPVHPYKTGGKMYLCEYADKIAKDFLKYLKKQKGKIGIQQGVDEICKIQKSYNHKQFHFVLTAFIMDLAEYFPHFIDQESPCYYGKNAKDCMDMLWEEKGQYNKKMELLCAHHNAHPYDMEDVLCDYIRYIENYVPKGYEHLTLEQVTHNSLIKNHNKHQSYVSK